MKKDNYTLEELLEDPSFQNWANRSDKHDIKKWDMWLEQYPENQQLAADAVMILKGVSFRKQQLAEETIKANWHALSDKLNTDTHDNFRIVNKRYAIAAAVSLLFLALSTLWFLGQPQRVAFSTQYGEIRYLTLPDSSRVVLNAHSTLTYNPSSLLGSEREIYLKGEAYFEVTKKKTDRPVKFTVITGQGQIEVVGTQFNVNERHGKTKVVLEEGRVHFRTPSDQMTRLNPGDMLVYDPAQPDIRLQQVNTDLYTSWRNKKLTFDDTPLLELIQILEDMYGVKVVIRNPDLYQKKITGEISAQHVELILKAVSRLFNIKVSRSGHTVYFS